MNDIKVNGKMVKYYNDKVYNIISNNSKKNSKIENEFKK
jgi:hypothetical protein